MRICLEKFMAAMADHDYHDGCDFCGHYHDSDHELAQVSNAAVDLLHDGLMRHQD